MGIFTRVSERDPIASAARRERGRSGRWALGIIGVSIAAVVIEAAVRSWTIDRPSIPQVVICVVLVAAGAVWFWSWSAFAGYQAGSALRLEANLNIKDASHRNKVARRLETAQRRALLLKRGMPLAVAAAIAGIAVLLL